MQSVGVGVGIHQVGIQYNQMLHLQHCCLSQHPMGIIIVMSRSSGASRTINAGSLLEFDVGIGR